MAYLGRRAWDLAPKADGALFENFHPVRKLLSGLLWSLSAALHQLPGERRERIRARLMRIRRKGEVFQLLVWPLVMITQIFGVFLMRVCSLLSCCL